MDVSMAAKGKSWDDNLLGGAINILKNMSSSMGMMIPYMKWEIKIMFETTSQIIYYQ
jgi:hypothetical protein